MEPSTPGLGHLVQGLVDAGIMAGWAALAAESLGYGVAFIALYGNPCGVRNALGLSGGLLPVVGLAIGPPAERPSPRPRQPPASVYGWGSVTPLEERARGVLEVYSHRAERFFPAVVGRGGYIERVGREYARCLREAGYEV